MYAIYITKDGIVEHSDLNWDITTECEIAKNSLIILYWSNSRGEPRSVNDAYLIMDSEGYSVPHPNVIPFGVETMAVADPDQCYFRIYYITQDFTVNGSV